MQGPSDNEVLQVSDQERRMGMDAVVRDDRAQLEELAAALHRLRQLRVNGHREHGLDSQLRAKVTLLESRESAERTSLDARGRRERPGQSQPEPTFLSW